MPIVERRERVLAALNGLLLLIGVLVVAAELVYLASRPGLHATFDATKTRAYTLSPQTKGLLRGLDGAWSVTVVVEEQATDPAVLRQVDEVLDRFGDTAEGLVTARLDPTDPAEMAQWETLLDRVQQAYRDESLAFAEALDEGEEEFAALQAFCAEEAETLGALAAAAPDLPEPIARQLQQLQTALAQLALQGDEFADAVTSLRATSPGQPIADDEGARSALVANHAHWSDQLFAASVVLEEWATRSDLPELLRRHATARRPAYEQLSLVLRRSQDRLAQLPPLELSEIGRALATGEAAIIVGPDGATVVPSWQLFPRVSGAEAPEGVAFDRRFRGEQVIAAAIRSLLEPMPLCVLVHAEDRSLLRPDDERRDLVAATDALRSARCDVVEWPVTATTRPAPRSGQAVVWIVVPPMQRSGLEMTRSERTLLDRTQALLDEGEAVMLTYARNLLPLFRQVDPWAEIAQGFGVSVDTGKVLFEWDRISAEESAVRPWQTLDSFADDGAVGAALEGQALVLTHPMAISTTAMPDVDQTPIAILAPSPDRWLERDWRQDGKDSTGPPAGGTLEAPVTSVLAAERRLDDGTRQRALFVASGGWLLTSVMDILESLGGDRILLTNPGNRELLLSGVAWLAGMDDWIAPGPTGREVARLRGIGPRARSVWLAVCVVGLPLTVLALGGVVAIRRRSA